MTKGRVYVTVNNKNELQLLHIMIMMERELNK